jgi:hypothetical protein
MSLRPSTRPAGALSTAARSYLLPVTLLLTTACMAEFAAPPAPVARKDTATPARPTTAASACDVRLSAGVDAPAVEVVEGKTTKS